MDRRLIICSSVRVRQRYLREGVFFHPSSSPAEGAIGVKSEQAD